MVAQAELALTAPVGCQGGSAVGNATHSDMDRFLASVERRALAIAELSIRDRDDAMDIVQDTMIRLVRRYSSRPSDEWTPLFYRILNNRIRDFARRRKVRGRVMAWFGRDDEPDPVAQAVDPEAALAEDELMAGETFEQLRAVFAELPERQREAFVLRCLEGHDVATTAQAMGVSDGSVKTHYSRALKRMREALAAE